ncbi:Ankyrin-2 [Drechslerella dactyloides]|uniref:Ankyrin-2 n=1 Tax=Drechslerella dactyloides TaxID=74499 RepID=A0AAD6IR21_DREDA|nr:Ankyrin-2 [Drechslerella dactyloides]
MAVRSLLRLALLTPLQIAIFLLISLPLALLAATTTFLSVILLSSRLLLVYVDLLFAVLFAAPPPHPRAIHPGAVKVRSPPLSIPRSPPRGSGGGNNNTGNNNTGPGYRSSSSQTAPSSPNISRKRLSAGAYTALHMSIASPPLTMKSVKVNGAKSSPSTPYAAAAPPPYALYSGKGGRKGLRVPLVEGRLFLPTHNMQQYTASALNWDDFSNNFATDLAPLITLFGEQVTKQFLSESLTIWDNVIFAMAPLGLVTAVVSAIRVAGTPSMRAFIGRAQESPGSAEVELLSCTSETTSELFNEGGIARVFGDPRILEVMVRPVDDGDGKGLLIGLFSEVGGAYWHEVTPLGRAVVGKRVYKSPCHRPNLSLNVRITKVFPVVQYTATMVGVLLQTGVLVFGGLTVYKYPDKFLTQEGKPAEAYAFPLMLCGTLMVCLGAFLCAFIIERSTDEVHYKQNAHSHFHPHPRPHFHHHPHKTKTKIMYWVQPGGQKLGDQVFGSFIGYSDRSRYIRSTKAPAKAITLPLLWAAVTLSVAGFIAQFVGLRALHASVVLAMVVATMIMGGIRSMLRTQRMEGDRDVISTFIARRAEGEKGLFSKHPKLLYGHELDLFAMHLFDIDSVYLHADLNGILQAEAQPPPGCEDVVRDAVEARTKLADITKINSDLLAWNDLDVRALAAELASAIEGAMDTVCQMERTMRDRSCHKWTVHLCTEHDNRASDITGLAARPHVASSVCSIFIKRSEDGSWTRVITRSETLDEIAVLVPACATDRSKVARIEVFDADGVYFGVSDSAWIRLFGDITPCTTRGASKAWVYKSDHTPLRMCAQDLFIFFLHSVFNNQSILGIGGKTEIRTGRNGPDVKNSVVEVIADAFEGAALGSREDAYLCIIPVLHALNKMPAMDDAIRASLKQAEADMTVSNWAQAERRLTWLVENFSTSTAATLEFWRKLAEFYHSAMREPDMKIAKLGFDGTCNLLKNTTAKSDDVRKIVRECGWIALRIAEDRSLNDRKNELLQAGATESTVAQYDNSVSVVEWAKRNEAVVLRYLAGKPDTDWNYQDSDGRTALYWAVKHGNEELVDLLLGRGADINAAYNDVQTALQFALRRGLLRTADELERRDAANYGYGIGDNDIPMRWRTFFE